MKTDVAGRIRNTILPANKPLLPLYEAIVNSIQAIEDAKETNGTITIIVRRDKTDLLSEQQPESVDITGFEVVDNGIGFTSENYDAFTTADTTFKVNRGGKGVGRFLWLVAFNEVQISSQYFENASAKHRSFKFVRAGDGIQNLSVKDSSASSRSTSVILEGLNKKFQNQCPKRTDTIAAHLIEHCLEYFIRFDCPTIILKDPSAEKTINLNQKFELEMAAKSERGAVKVDKNSFTVLHVRLYSSHETEHTIHFCANSRVVKSEKLKGRVPNLSRQLEDKQGKAFVYAAYVDSSLLDSQVNAERTDFAIPEGSVDGMIKETDWESIRNAIITECRGFLQPFTEPVRIQKQARIDDFVAKEGPMYRPILKYIGAKIENIEPDITNDDLDLRMYQAYHEVQVELHSQGKKLLEQNPSDDGWEGFYGEVAEYFAKVTDINKSDLARYVCHRRAILDFLQKQLSTKGDGKYPLEDRVHKIVFPMRKTSEDVPLNEHNLWLLDEKLVYHEFLASDKPLSSIPKMKTNSHKEPDLIVFDKACAFVTGNETPFSAVTIIEFKRPMRDDYKDKDNPFQQVYEYIKDIRAGKARTKNGRDIPISNDIPFTCYIVADITKTLEDQANQYTLTRTPDGQGFFGFNKNYNAYVEVMSYTKMVSDAKKRNMAFFEKLGLPTAISL